MIAILAPAKTMDFESKMDIDPALFKTPLFTEETGKIYKVLKSMDQKKISEVMKVSPKIAEEVFNNISFFSSGSDSKRLRPAAFAYTGETFKGLCPDNFSSSDLKFAEKHIRILSALYGVLSPLTLIEPYRLEMALKLEDLFNGRFSVFWKEKITDELNSLLSGSKDKTLVNLASQEYTSAIHRKKLNGNILDITFKQDKDGKLKTAGTLSKKARGMMASYIVKERVENTEKLKDFSYDGYAFREDLSGTWEYIFVKD